MTYEEFIISRLVTFLCLAIGFISIFFLIVSRDKTEKTNRNHKHRGRVDTIARTEKMFVFKPYTGDYSLDYNLSLQDQKNGY